MKRVLYLILAFSLLTGLAWGQDEGTPVINESNLLMKAITLRPGVTADVNVKVYESLSDTCQATLGNTILAVPGVMHTAATMGPFAKTLIQIFETKVWPGALISGNVCRVLSIDLPGHGLSGFPQGNIKFGEMMLEDYVAAIFGSMDRLRAIGIKPSILIGHSAGGLLVQMMQQDLLSRKEPTSFRKKYNVRSVILLAPAAPAPLPQSIDLNAFAAMAGYMSADPVYGSFVLLDPASWIGVMFMGSNYMLHPNAPTPDQVIANRYVAPEPLVGVMQLVGVPPLRRPVVDAGIFAPRNSTFLQIVAYDNDPALSATLATSLYQYLSFDMNNTRLAIVKGNQAIHDLHIADPTALLNATAGKIDVPYVIPEGSDPDPF